ncbi:NUDIX hydrolase [Paraliomyxa miuraensis]|uniref:NUDIX hydrolase n=1 Tax=Paraliomyxa miuraensis TaxID=376150 RepID=UPI00224D6473|nr:NUDIX domain-containing protein [Paraliomyxa miuraensis]MCX4246813.1 NUDIX hydrolase [Paraliomyxa miuraensis]
MPRIYDHPRPAIAVDIVVLTIRHERLQVLLIERALEPFAGQWALPGGFVKVEGGRGGRGESLDAAARRELREETGLDVDEVWLEQLHAFGAPSRDPRGRVVSIAYLAVVSPDLFSRVQAATDAAAARWFTVDELPRLAFDHAEILGFALDHLRARLSQDPRVAFHLVPRELTIGDLRRVYEIIEGTTYDKANFRRRFLRLVDEGKIEPIDGQQSTGGRPAAVYRLVERAD